MYTLRQSQSHPDQFHSLVACLAGHRDFFAELDKSLQDEIIRRTKFR